MEIDYSTLYGAWQSFRKGKRPSRAIDEFAYNLEENLTLLSNQILSRSYTHGTYSEVILWEKKRRDLAVANVRDRVIHRLLYNYLCEIFDKTFDYDVWSCRKHKGLHQCLERTKNLLLTHTNSYVWRADITKFFDSVSHEFLINCLGRKIGARTTIMWVCKEVISSYGTGKGMPIGNLTSQIFANIYLNEFDRFVRRILKPQAYVRYGDDFILFANTRHQVHQFRSRCLDFLNSSLKLSINPKNDIIIPASSGLYFLGHNISDSKIKVDSNTARRVLNRVGSTNISSYRSLYLERDIQQQLDWILLAKYVDI